MWRRLDRDIRAVLSARTGRRVRPLAWGRTEDDQWCVALPDRLAWGHGDDWRELLWHHIGHGGWNAELRQLRWTTVDGRPGTLRLREVGQLPDAFSDRVNATIVARERIDIDGTDDGVVISGRRNLADPDAPLLWRATPMRGTRLSDPEVAARVDQALERVRAEYDISG